jgi:hypothetical protein
MFIMYYSFSLLLHHFTVAFESSNNTEKNIELKGKNSNMIFSVLFFLEALHTVSAMKSGDDESRKVFTGGGEMMRIFKKVIGNLTSEAKIGLIYHENQILLLAFVANVIQRRNFSGDSLDRKDRCYSPPILSTDKDSRDSESDHNKRSKPCKNVLEGNLGWNLDPSTLTTPYNTLDRHLIAEESDQNIDPSSLLSSIMYYIVSVCSIPVQNIREKRSHSDVIPSDSCDVRVGREARQGLNEGEVNTDQRRRNEIEGKGDGDVDVAVGGEGIGGIHSSGRIRESSKSEQDKSSSALNLSEASTSFQEGSEIDVDSVADARAFSTSSTDQISRWVECGDRTALWISIVSLPFILSHPLSLPLPLPVPLSMSPSSCSGRLISTSAGLPTHLILNNENPDPNSIFGSNSSSSPVEMPQTKGVVLKSSDSRYYPLLKSVIFSKDMKTQVRTLICTSCRLQTLFKDKLKYVRAKDRKTCDSQLCTDLLEAIKSCARVLSIAQDVIVNLMMAPQCVPLTTFNTVLDCVRAISGTEASYSRSLITQQHIDIDDFSELCLPYLLPLTPYPLPLTPYPLPLTSYLLPLTPYL